MTFTELYEEEKNKVGGARPMEWLQRVAVAAIVSVETAYQWGVGSRTPHKPAAALVARELGISAEELFPNIKNR